MPLAERSGHMVAAVGLLVIACQPNAPDAELQKTSEESRMSDEPTAVDVRDGLLAIAKRDLSEKLGVSGDRIEVIEFREVTWPNGSVGCPEPGMVYKQVLVNGSLIRLRVGDAIYHYHAGGGRGPFYCEHPEPPLPPGTEGFGEL